MTFAFVQAARLRELITSLRTTIHNTPQGGRWLEKSRAYCVTVSGPSKTVRLMTSDLAWCGPWATPFGAKKNAPVV